jgi:hypothetical protein
MVHAADAFTYTMQFGSGGNPFPPVPDQTAWDLIGVTLPVLERLIPQLRREYEDARSILLGSADIPQRPSRSPERPAE